jgi:hypothetical protein
VIQELDRFFGFAVVATVFAFAARRVFACATTARTALAGNGARTTSTAAATTRATGTTRFRAATSGIGIVVVTTRYEA